MQCRVKTDGIYDFTFSLSYTTAFSLAVSHCVGERTTLSYNDAATHRTIYTMASKQLNGFSMYCWSSTESKRVIVVGV